MLHILKCLIQFSPNLSTEFFLITLFRYSYRKFFLPFPFPLFSTDYLLLNLQQISFHFLSLLSVGLFFVLHKSLDQIFCLVQPLAFSWLNLCRVSRQLKLLQHSVCITFAEVNVVIITEKLFLVLFYFRLHLIAQLSLQTLHNLLRDLKNSLSLSTWGLCKN